MRWVGSKGVMIEVLSNYVNTFTYLSNNCSKVDLNLSNMTTETFSKSAHGIRRLHRIVGLCCFVVYKTNRTELTVNVYSIWLQINIKKNVIGITKNTVKLSLSLMCLSYFLFLSFLPLFSSITPSLLPSLPYPLSSLTPPQPPTLEKPLTCRPG